MAYNVGSLTLSQGSSTITGNGTYFVQVAQAEPADLLYFVIDQKQIVLQVVSVVDDTTLRVKQLDGRAFSAPDSIANIKYALIQTFTTSLPAKLAQRVAATQAQWFTREQQMTGWFESTDDAYPITNYLGNESLIPTPDFIRRLAEVGADASEQLGMLTDDIAQCQSQVANLAPRLTQFDADYLSAQQLHANVEIKHSEVAAAHSAVNTHKSSIDAIAQEISTHHDLVSQYKQQVSADSELVASHLQMVSTHSTNAAASADNAAQSEVNCTVSLNAVKAVETSINQSVNNAVAELTEAASAEQQTLSQLAASHTSQYNDVHDEAVLQIETLETNLTQSVDNAVAELTETASAEQQALSQLAASHASQYNDTHNQALQQIDTLDANLTQSIDSAVTGITETATAEQQALSELAASHASQYSDTHTQTLQQIEGVEAAIKQEAESLRSYLNNGISDLVDDVSRAQELANITRLECDAYASLSALLVNKQAANITQIKGAFSAVLTNTLNQSHIDHI
ncbi:hypothetical protein HUZ36_05085 [Pseudoalteromonas sp. McH1-7]|uniref:hypothetical protein n=1 Tax=Pseudoalteromonas sp. McH1-7 TaxID=2745574 RepID=UPI0015923A86|nr:hypothetical protein [Pseudoalteromonas sp. McH1-7]NUZ10148.1 hypothetical protein [Pseudoalteromonas sp. McH1-7]